MKQEYEDKLCTCTECHVQSIQHIKVSDVKLHIDGLSSCVRCGTYMCSECRVSHDSFCSTCAAMLKAYRA